MHIHAPRTSEMEIRYWNSTLKAKQAPSNRSHSQPLIHSTVLTSTCARTGLDGHEIAIFLLCCPNQPVYLHSKGQFGGSSHISIISIRLTDHDIISPDAQVYSNSSPRCKHLPVGHSRHDQALVPLLEQRGMVCRTNAVRHQTGVVSGRCCPYMIFVRIC